MSHTLNAEHPCPECQQASFEWGAVHPTGANVSVKFSTDEDSSWLGLAGKEVKARRCLCCGRLELFAKS